MARKREEVAKESSEQAKKLEKVDQPNSLVYSYLKLVGQLFRDLGNFSVTFRQLFRNFSRLSFLVIPRQCCYSVIK
jgi:hypothetical protein